VNKENIIFLDIGGTYYNAQSEPITEWLDGNKFLAEILDAYKTFIKDRITIEDLIGRLGTRLSTGGWYIPLEYTLVYPSNEQEILVGGYSKRYTQANELKVKFGIQMRISLENPNTITVYSTTTGKHRKLSYQFAGEFANILNTLIDPDNTCENIDEINIVEYSVYDDDLESRDLAYGIKEADFPVIGLCFHLNSGEKLAEFLDTSKGLDVITHSISLFMDSIAGDI